MPRTTQCCLFACSSCLGNQRSFLHSHHNRPARPNNKPTCSQLGQPANETVSQFTNPSQDNQSLSLQVVKSGCTSANRAASIQALCDSVEVSIVSVVRGQSLTQPRLFIGCWGSSGNTWNQRAYKALNKLTNGTWGVTEGKVLACVCVSASAIFYDIV